jgi:hypothetical protein
MLALLAVVVTELYVPAFRQMVSPAVAFVRAVPMFPPELSVVVQVTDGRLKMNCSTRPLVGTDGEAAYPTT